MRSQRRKAEEQERREMVRLGMAEAPAPKVKMSNLMRVLGNEAVQDPTMVEAVVKKQMALRQKKHEDHNNAMKLTKDQKVEKGAKKKKEDEHKGLKASVYVLHSSTAPSANIWAATALLVHVLFTN